MLNSLKEYIVSLGRWIWVIIVDVLLAGTGAFLDISKTVQFPTWLWVTLFGMAFIIAPFLSFHKLRKQRDDAQN